MAYTTLHWRVPKLSGPNSTQPAEKKIISSSCLQKPAAAYCRETTQCLHKAAAKDYFRYRSICRFSKLIIWSIFVTQFKNIHPSFSKFNVMSTKIFSVM